MAYRYYEDTNVLTINALMSALKAEQVAMGWTVEDLSTLSTAPSAGFMGREFVARIPGRAASAENAAAGYFPTRGYAAVQRHVVSTGQHRLHFWGCTGMRGFDTPIPIAAIQRSTTTVTVDTTGSHGGVVTTDRVLMNGCAAPSLNEGWANSNTAPAYAVATTPSGTRFTYTSKTSGNVADPGPGGRVMWPYNEGGVRALTSGTGLGMVLADSPMSAYFWTDEYGQRGVVGQGGVFAAFSLGMPGNRRHIPLKKRGAGFSQGSIAAGSNIQVDFGNDYVTPYMRTGQKVWLVHPEAAQTEVCTIGSIPDVNSIVLSTVAASGGSYPAGTLVGLDPCPIGVYGPTSGVTSSQLAFGDHWFCHHLDGTRTNPSVQNFASIVNSGFVNTTINGDALDTFYHPQNVYCNRVTANAPKGIRGPFNGFFALPTGGSHTDFDEHRAGDATDDDWRTFPTQIITTGWCLGIGPGVP
jgi:hypothetical protein